MTKKVPRHLLDILGSVYIFLVVISTAAKWTNPRYLTAYLS